LIGSDQSLLHCELIRSVSVTLGIKITTLGGINRARRDQQRDVYVCSSSGFESGNITRHGLQAFLHRVAYIFLLVL
jgi:hypothetical protein